MTLEEFVAEMLDQARSNAEAMESLTAEQQAKFIGDRVRHKDAVVALYPDEKASAGGHTVAVITGAARLAAAGVNLATVNGQSFGSTLARHNRPARIDAFLVSSAVHVQCMIMAYGDMPDARRWRRDEERKDGPQAIRNVRQYCTPYGFQHHPI